MVAGNAVAKLMKGLNDILKMQFIYYDKDVIKYLLAFENSADFLNTHQISAPMIKVCT